MARPPEIVTEEELSRLSEELALVINEARLASLAWMDANRRQSEARRARAVRDQAREEAVHRQASLEQEIAVLQREIAGVLDLTTIERPRDLARLRLAELEARLAELRRFTPGPLPPPPDGGIFL